MKYPGTVGHVCNSSTCGIRQKDREFKPSMVYVVKCSLKGNGMEYLFLIAEPNGADGDATFRRSCWVPTV